MSSVQRKTKTAYTFDITLDETEIRVLNRALLMYQDMQRGYSLGEQKHLLPLIAKIKEEVDFLYAEEDKLNEEEDE